MDEERLTVREAIEVLKSLGFRASTSTMANWRSGGGGPSYGKRQGRIFYTKDALATWVAAQQ